MEIKDKSYYKHARTGMLPFVPKEAKTILEIGCGQGNFSGQFVKDGIEVWGVEPDPTAAKFAIEKLFKVFESAIDEALKYLPDDYFDVIIMNDVLEHLTYPSEVLKKLKIKLTKEGVTVSSIPNVRYSKNIFNLIFKKDWKYTESGILDNTHFRFFTKKSIQRLHMDSGYSIQCIKGINRTKSFLFFPFAVLVNILLLCSQLDMFYMQYATVARRNI
ncbi:class I SAM-dependent methyltransferase [uncultured Polaribacter sp.]|uniref:class I SAM-dependent methyltransferase n=1 Tax=uncultured Polaribacter sp. TaxID=174711 RepID=UPI00260F80E1|nr:class I SAM-dependent methyltransferase [uncultured Polaribacter sp.]